MKIRTAFFVTLGALIVPILLCAIYLFLIQASIGPVVFIYSLVAAVTVGGVWGFALSKKYGDELGVLGVFIVPVLWVLLINYFMVVTYVFGIKDYNEI